MSLDRSMSGTSSAAFSVACRRLAVGGLRVGGVVLAFECGEQLAEADGVDAGDVFVEVPRVELAAELAGFFLRDEPRQAVAAGAEDRQAVREEVLDDLRQRERRVFEPEPNEFGVLVEQRDDLAGLAGQAALAGRQQVEVRQHDDATLDGPADGLAELRYHRADQPRRHRAVLRLGVVLTRPAVEVDTADRYGRAAASAG